MMMEWDDVMCTSSAMIVVERLYSVAQAFCDVCVLHLNDCVCYLFVARMRSLLVVG